MERQWCWAELAETSSFIAHRRQVLRCAPEQLRHASFEERTVVEFPDNELLGIKNLLERGHFPKSQFTDVVAEEHPPQPQALPSPSAPEGAQSAAELFHQSREIQEPKQAPRTANRAADFTPGEMSVEGPEIAPSSSTYGPVRRRCTGKQPDNVVYRPPEMRHEDLSDLLNEIATEDLTNQAGNQRVSDEAMNSPRGTSWL